MATPNNLKYAKTHEWVEFLDNGHARVGLTDHAQQSMGDIVFLELPEPGREAGQHEAVGEVESVKAVSDIFCPLAGKIMVVNEGLADTPERINEAPYEAWLFELADYSGEGELIDAAAYDAFCAEKK